MEYCCVLLQVANQLLIHFRALTNLYLYIKNNFVPNQVPPEVNSQLRHIIDENILSVLKLLEEYDDRCEFCADLYEIISLQYKELIF